MPRAKEPKTEDEPGFDAVLDDLRHVVEELEAGELSLEQALARYEQGVALARRGHALLERAEQRVELLTSGANAPVPMPLASTADDE